MGYRKQSQVIECGDLGAIKRVKKIDIWCLKKELWLSKWEISGIAAEQTALPQLNSAMGMSAVSLAGVLGAES